MNPLHAGLTWNSRPALIEGCLAGPGLTLEPGETPTDIMN
jgi:hypothetical protein